MFAAKCLSTRCCPAPLAVFAWPFCDTFQALFSVCKALGAAFLPSQLWVGLLREGGLQNCCDVFVVNTEDGAWDCVVYIVLGQQECSRVSVVSYVLSGKKKMKLELMKSLGTHKHIVV